MISRRISWGITGGIIHQLMVSHQSLGAQEMEVHSIEFSEHQQFLQISSPSHAVAEFHQGGFLWDRRMDGSIGAWLLVDKGSYG